jgi:hypothetical protein
MVEEVEGDGGNRIICTVRMRRHITKDGKAEYILDSILRTGKGSSVFINYSNKGAIVAERVGSSPFFSVIETKEALNLGNPQRAVEPSIRRTSSFATVGGGSR